MKLLYVLFALIVATGCTENSRARAFGGHTEIVLPLCHRLVTASWKLDDLWYLTEPMGNNLPRSTVLRESSQFGVMQGSVTFREKCDRPTDE